MRREDFTFYNLTSKEHSKDISFFFPGWRGEEERVVVFAPHDDDAILGPGYLLQAVQVFGGEVHVVIFCNGSGGYSLIEHKHLITALRFRETIRAYAKLGIPEVRIHRLDYEDYSVWPFIGWHLPGKEEGTFRKVLPLLRRIGATRLLLPNGYKEHLDHTATFMVGAFDGPQAGDPVMADWGEARSISTFLQYAVWSDFSPEDALLQGRNSEIRANLAIKAPYEAEQVIRDAMQEYETQAKIVAGLLESRKERKINEREVMEVYLRFEPRPKCDYRKYVDYLISIDK
ncbi:PIG-L family deacetylase [Thermatribacter velox]|uniref:PIG-L family deacetylase n=1 Tax=Thermatribacter velox TaxID=3039681 RepID=A0ABZ2YAE3_9BACT